MAEHEITSQKKQEKGDQKHHAVRKESQPLFDHHAWEQGIATAETPFAPRMDEHAELMARAPSDEHRYNLVMNLQQTYGNRYVQRLVESMKVQAKLNLSAPNDVYEQEADRVAKVVTRSINSQVQRQPIEEEEELQAKPFLQRQAEEEEELQAKPFLQRQVEEEEELQAKPFLQRQAEEEEELQEKPFFQRQVEEEEELQKKFSEVQRHSTTVSENLETRIKAEQGGGHPLTDTVREPMEQAFKADFSNVRVHTDSEADALNQQLSAKAFTTGQDVFFRENEYSPGSGSGRELIAHELTHVVQQTGGTKLRPKGQETKDVSRTDDNASGTIQRKTRDLHIDKRLMMGYAKKVNARLNQLIALINGYNSFNIQDTNYDLHLAQLKAIKGQANGIERLIESTKFLFKKRTFRSLGGPFRHGYALLTRNLRKLAGYASGIPDFDPNYKGEVDKEIAKVEKQKQRGLEISA